MDGVHEIDLFATDRIYIRLWDRQQINSKIFMLSLMESPECMKLIWLQLIDIILGFWDREH